MKVGLILCDEVSPELQGEHGTYRDMFSTMLSPLEILPFRAYQNELPTDFVCDAYVLTGSRYSVYDDMDWIRNLNNFVQELQNMKKPVVGVCFGHQMLAEALGGKVEKSSKGWCVGPHTFNIELPQDWMVPVKNEVSLLMMCQDQVKTLPPGSQIIASTHECPIGMFLIDDHMLGIQAHPEFSNAYCQTLIERRMDRIGQGKSAAALSKLNQDPDRDIIAKWIMQFITDRCLQV